MAMHLWKSLDKIGKVLGEILVRFTGLRTMKTGYALVTRLTVIGGEIKVS